MKKNFGFFKSLSFLKIGFYNWLWKIQNVSILIESYLEKAFAKLKSSKLLKVKLILIKEIWYFFLKNIACLFSRRQKIAKFV